MLVQQQQPVSVFPMSATASGDSLRRSTSNVRKPRREDSSSASRRSAAALVLQQVPVSLPTALKVEITTSIDIGVEVHIPSAQLDGPGLPATCKAGSSAQVAYVSSSTLRGSDTKGELRLRGFDPVPFKIFHSRQGTSYVGSQGRWRCTVLTAPSWNWRESAEKPTEGKAADLELSGLLLTVKVREATPAELKRYLQLQALKEAELDQDYDTLHAQVTKARAAGVDMVHVERGEEKLKVLRKQGLHVAPGADKETLREQMDWSKVTKGHGTAKDSVSPCSQNANCPCNDTDVPGEVFEVVDDAVQQFLGEGTDEELYKELVESALAVDDGSVWKAGGKFIFSAFNRNQSPLALTRMLQGAGRRRCSELLTKLVKCSEDKYGGYVVAVQINFHPHGGTYHDQHRDIYSGKQRAGVNCTCSFKECVGTVCYSVGSSRISLLESMTDELATISKCCDACEGRQEKRWLHSGCAMYFNDRWNQNHMHGIPAMSDQEVGPRISVAFLLGAEVSYASICKI